MAAKAKKKANHSQRFTALVKDLDREQLHSIDSAIAGVKSKANAKFDETVDIALKLGIDARKSDQNVRGVTTLPHGTGKKKSVAVLAKGDAAKEAEAAGADFVGDEDLIKKIQEGWKDFDVMVAASDMAPQIGKIGRFLGTKTPNKKNGTVTDAVGQAVKEIKSAARVEYRIDKAGVVHVPIGKVSFTDAQLKENAIALLDAVIRAKPSASKGRFLQSVTMSSTMGPGFKLDPVETSKASGH
ncbi:MAG: 50S ribosomal protein L1 [Armatimonadetes bacterium]|nr:50S ribosomal protein L1 [Armatimonadota bacterium]MBS1712301.1 50S ribosomal protein L1 [Armatimonadota bacterium]MBX3108008.1 50S ribosomal protein L1 [Fimbriimonadaceae bacterium]